MRNYKAERHELNRVCVNGRNIVVIGLLGIKNYFVFAVIDHVLEQVIWKLILSGILFIYWFKEAM